MTIAFLDVLERLGSATVDELVVELRKDITQVRHMIEEAIEHGKIAVDHARPEAFKRVHD